MRKQMSNLKKLQMAYMVAQLENQQVGEQCILCWGTSCDCNAADVKTDAFLNIANENEVLSYSEIKYA